ncbi:MAG: DUF1127 domain-containing protein [Alphaproteobacteria bacterium]|nr:DUF1127 domain-containing protein [Alphaproteobacteria bacterium]
MTMMTNHTLPGAAEHREHRGLMAAWRKSMERRRVPAALLQLDDHLLRDISLARKDIWSNKI